MAKINKIIKQNSENDILDLIKNKVKSTYDYFYPNYKAYNVARKFVFKSSLTDDQVAYLQQLGKPIIEINIGEMHLSRLVGEFFKQEPSFKISPKDGSNIDQNFINLLENHIRSIFFDANLNGLQTELYMESMSGGFSAFKIVTDYLHEFSLDQGIFIRKCEPTLVGFDKNAVLPHKGDSDFCFECFPMSKEKYESKYGSTNGMKFIKEIEGFSWSYKTDTDAMILVADFYEKKFTKQKIVKLRTGQVITAKDYEMMRDNWNGLEQFPVVIASRETEIVQVERIRVAENKIIEDPVKTDFRHLPIIFVDRNSKVLREGGLGSAQQFTRDYLYQARGVQGLKNLAAISMANELESMMQTKLMAALEGIPEQYADAYKDLQKPNTLIYRAYHNNDPNKPLPKPEVIPRPPAPPEIAQAFQLADQSMQMVLGNFDASLGINDNQLSGTAIREGAMQSNFTAMPGMFGYFQAINQACVIFLDLFPKYYTEERSIPTKDITGKVNYVKINGNNPYQMNYRPETLDVKIEASVSFEVQRAQAYRTFIQLVHDIPFLQPLLQEPEVLEAVLDNIDIRGIDAIKQAIPRFLQKMQLQQQMAAQNNPIALKQQELQLKAQQNQVENQLEAGRLQNDQESIATDRMLALAKVNEISDNSTLEANKIQAEQARTTVQLAAQVADVQHQHKMDEHHKAMDLLNLHHTNEQKNADRKTNEKRNSRTSK